MARQPHHKLIRDRIPDILNREGVPFAVQPMSPEEYRQALRQKLVEEAIEAATADQADLVTELADLLEVIDATLMAYNLPLRPGAGLPGATTHRARGLSAALETPVDGD
jgi:predicted house-cleaning noncanonical NTP pyrophosphatase (MazG superfamily)